MSLWSDLKDVGWHALNQRLRPDVQVGYGSRLGRDCRFGTDIQIGANARIYDSKIGRHVRIEPSNRLTQCRLEGFSVIGAGCDLADFQLGRYSYLAGSARASRIQFGRFCSVGPELLCGLGEHPTDRVSASPIFYSTLQQCGLSFSARNTFEESKRIQVGHDVWIGARVFIRDGVTVGNGVIIGAGAIVTHDVPAYAVVGGVSARILRMRFSDDTIRELEALAWWDWDEARLRAAQPFLADKDPHVLLEWSRSVRPAA